VVVVLDAKHTGRIAPEGLASGPLSHLHARELLDLYQSIGFVASNTAVEATLESLPRADEGKPRVVALVRTTHSDLMLPAGERPDRAFERRFIAAAERGELAVVWKRATAADLASVRLVGQF
jgi:hypothetical protein